MPSLVSTLRYAYKKYIQSRRARIKHILLWLLAFLLLSACVETFVFNFRTWTSLFNEPIDLSEKINLQQTTDGRFVVSASDNIIEMRDINQQINNIHLKMNKNQDAKVFNVKLNFTDSGHSTYFDTTEYTVGIPDVSVSTSSQRSQYFSIHSTGKIGNLKLQIYGEHLDYPLYIDNIVANAHYPFNFVIWRFLTVFAFLYVIYIFRPRSSIYKIKLIEHSFYSKVIISTTVLVQAILLSAYLLLGSNLVGLATSNYNYGDWDGVSAVNTFEVAGDNAQQYAELAKSFTQGKLHLSQEPPSYLKTMEDPYDKGSRDEMQKETGESYLFDVAYYDGHYYVYFGIVPVILFYLPFYLLFGSNFPTAIGVLIMAILFILGLTVLLDRFARYHFKRVSMGLFLLLQIPLVCCSGVLYLCKFPTFYSLPIACAITFAVWGLYFWMRARSSYRPCGWFIAGSLCLALIAGCRPQILLIAFVALPLFWRKFITNARTEGLLTRSGKIQFLYMVAPFVVVGLSVAWYNYARFGSITNFGANYNLTMNDMTQRGIQISRVLPAFFAFFIQPPNVTGVFPFINPVLFETTYIGQTIKEVTFGGVLVCLPVLWILFFAAPILSYRKKTRKTNTVTGVILVLTISALFIALLDAQMAGILQRYYADFSFMLLIAAVLLAFIANESVSQFNKKYRRIFVCITLAIVGISVVYSTLICFVPETGWYGDVYDWAYIDFIRHILFWV